MMMNTSAAMPMMIINGPAIRKPMPSVAKPRIIRITKMIATVMLKFSASLAWSFTNGMVSFFTSQMISGPMNQPQPPIQPVTRPPSSADKCANIAHWRSSAVGAPAGGGGAPAGDEDVGGVTDSGGTLMAVLPQTVVDETDRVVTLALSGAPVKRLYWANTSCTRCQVDRRVYRAACAGRCRGEDARRCTNAATRTDDR